VADQADPHFGLTLWQLLAHGRGDLRSAHSHHHPEPGANRDGLVGCREQGADCVALFEDDALKRAARVFLDSPFVHLRREPFGDRPADIVAIGRHRAELYDLERLPVGGVQRFGLSVEYARVEISIGRRETPRGPIAQPGTNERRDRAAGVGHQLVHHPDRYVNVPPGAVQWREVG
jgi:hypothetical protein